MPVTLTIKNVPDELAERRRAIAAALHRWLQGEPMAIVESAGRSHERGKSGAALQDPAHGQSYGAVTVLNPFIA